MNSGTTAMTLEEKMAGAGYKNSGFDYLRLLLSTAVICFHSVIICRGEFAQANFNGETHGVPFNLVVPMFFALSGFLVAGSLMRSPNLGIFLGLRAFRIVPALLVDTLFIAVIAGPFLTTHSVGDYFSNSQLHAYFLNIIGDIHYYLPGVFKKNPTDIVNGQLWTIPFELACYTYLAILALIGVHRSRVGFALIVLGGIAALQIHQFHIGGGAWRTPEVCFFVGVLFYVWRDLIAWRQSYFWASFLLSMLLTATSTLGYVLALPITYMTVYLGLLHPAKVSLLKAGDYSYGLYLYGFPLQQIVYSFLPIARVWWGNILIGLPVSLLFAAISWHFVEHKILGRKGLLYRILPWGASSARP